MFVLELSKPSGICLAFPAERRPGPRRLPGLLALRRRLAPDEHRRRTRSGAARGSRPSSSTACSSRPARAPGTRSRCGPRTAPRSRCTSASASGRPGHRRRYYHDNGEDALIMWLETLAPTPSTRLDPRASRRPATTPAPRSSTGRAIRSNVISSQAAAHERFGGIVPEVAARHHLELINPVVDAALADAGIELDDVDALAVTRGPGPDRRAADRRQHGEGARGRGRQAAARGRPPARARRRQLPRARPDRAAVPVPDRQRRPHAARRGHAPTTPTRSSARRSTTPPARRSTRRRGCSSSAIPAARRSSARRRGGDPRGVRVPGRDDQRPAARLQLQRPEDRAPLRGPRARARRRRASAAPTSRRASRPRSSTSWSPSCAAPPAAAAGAIATRRRPGTRSRWAAEWPRTRCCASGSPSSARPRAWS